MPHNSAQASYRRIAALTWPMVVSGCSTPLLGLVDTAIIGNLGSAPHLGAIALGALVFNFVYWGFGFLRMGTTGLTAQASGAGNAGEVRASLWRAGALGTGLGLLLILLQWPIGALVFAILGGSAEVEALAENYFTIRIWAGPATLTVYAITGWFIGLQKTRLALYLQLFLNLLNIVLDTLFVVGFGWGVSGVAAGSAIAEVATVVFGLGLVRCEFRRRGWPLRAPEMGAAARPAQIRRLLRVNFDIFVRTLLLVFSFAWFTNQSALLGDVTIAANYILLQFVSFSAFFLDGFAFAAEALVGTAIGAQSRPQLLLAAARSTQLAAATAVGLSVFIVLAGPAMIGLLTNVPEVRNAAGAFLFWAAIMPVVAVWCYLLDGIFIGATQTRDMRNMAIVSVLVYLTAHDILLDRFGNHGLWAAFLIFQATRGATLAARFPALVRMRIPKQASAVHSSRR